jgi:hypothetical protein
MSHGPEAMLGTYYAKPSHEASGPTGHTCLVSDRLCRRECDILRGAYRDLTHFLAMGILSSQSSH